MNPNDMEALQMALLQELNDIDGVRGVATERNSDETLVLLIYVTGDQCAEDVQTRLETFEELPPYKLERL